MFPEKNVCFQGEVRLQGALGVATWQGLERLKMAFAARNLGMRPRMGTAVERRPHFECVVVSAECQLLSTSSSLTSPSTGVCCDPLRLSIYLRREVRYPPAHLFFSFRSTTISSSVCSGNRG